MSKINVLDAIEPSKEITGEVTAKANEMLSGGAVSNPVEYNWAAVLTPKLKALAEGWADDLDPARGDGEISGFASDIMVKIKDQTKQVLRDTAVRDVPEANAIFTAFLDDLNKVDYNFKFQTPGAIRKLMAVIGALKDQLTAFLDSIKTLDDKLEGMEATIMQHIMKLHNYLAVLQGLKDEYKKMVPVMFAATYAMLIVVKREEKNLETLKAKAKKFVVEHDGQANPLFDEEVNEKVTQLDLCRQRLFQLAFQAAKGFIMVPVIETSMKAARIIKSEMENTINSTMADIRAALTVIVAQNAIENAAATQEKSDAVARKAQKALGERLERTVGAMERMNKSKETNLADLKVFAAKVNDAIRRTQSYSAGLMKNVKTMNETMTEISEQYNETLMGLGASPVVENDLEV